jgi:hypothetical protein
VAFMSELRSNSPGIPHPARNGQPSERDDASRQTDPRYLQTARAIASASCPRPELAVGAPALSVPQG